jgi:uncharacterized protein (DUF934 family)
MPLIRDGRVVADDWVRLAPGEQVPAGGKLLLPLNRLIEEGAGLADAGHSLGAEVSNDMDLAALDAWVQRLQLVAVAFPKSSDGRGFSMAARLRRHGYRGELRASGHLIADQYALAKGCGFDSVEISEDQAARQPEAHWAEAERSMSLAYQRGYGGVRNILSARWASAE